MAREPPRPKRIHLIAAIHLVGRQLLGGELRRQGHAEQRPRMENPAGRRPLRTIYLLDQEPRGSVAAAGSQHETRRNEAQRRGGDISWR